MTLKIPVLIEQHKTSNLANYIEHITRIRKKCRIAKEQLTMWEDNKNIYEIGSAISGDQVIHARKAPKMKRLLVAT